MCFKKKKKITFFPVLWTNEPAFVPIIYHLKQHSMPVLVSSLNHRREIQLVSRRSGILASQGTHVHASHKQQTHLYVSPRWNQKEFPSPVSRYGPEIFRSHRQFSKGVCCCDPDIEYRSVFYKTRIIVSLRTGANVIPVLNSYLVFFCSKRISQVDFFLKKTNL